MFYVTYYTIIYDTFPGFSEFSEFKQQVKLTNGFLQCFNRECRTGQWNQVISFSLFYIFRTPAWAYDRRYVHDQSAVHLSQMCKLDLGDHSPILSRACQPEIQKAPQYTSHIQCRPGTSPSPTNTGG